MYLELFKLQELPFRLSPDPSFLYLSKHHARAKAYMESTIWFTDGFVVITGEIGSGKTTLIETFLRELEKDVVVAQVNQTQLSPIEFLQAVLVQFGFSPFKMKKAEVLSTLNTFLIEQYANNRKVLLIIDEAQNLSDRVLEEVRLLSGVETTKEKVLRIILAGQPELNEKLNSPELLQLTQRIRLRFHLTPLSKADTRAYVQHRLEVAGSQGRQIFHESCYNTIFRYTGGTPRLINTLCDTAMMAAFARDRDTVSLEDVDTAIRELQWVEFTARTHRVVPNVVPGAVPGAVPAVAPAPAVPELSQQPSAPAQVARVLLADQGQTVLERPLRPGRLIIGRTP
ncbi:MAG TPA: AAA family ATPase, partial [Steroidobacteraceae bacterium]|nr:AAA family ATPase [Steroidobacteraceae bacterium]